METNLESMFIGFHWPLFGNTVSSRVEFKAGHNRLNRQASVTRYSHFLGEPQKEGFAEVGDIITTLPYGRTGLDDPSIS